MGKFGIGARVIDDGGDAAEIVNKRKGERLLRYDDKDYGLMWWAKDGLTIVTAVANDNASISPEISVKAYSTDAAGNNWVPKVGDRVRYCGGSGLGAEAGALATVSHNYDGRFLQIKWDRDGLDHMQGDGGYYVGQFEPIVATPTTWAPSVGKFGKTRDGRKVGPYAPAFGGIWRVGSDHDTAVFEDGRRNRSHETPHDLVAEWVEPVAEPVDVAPATATPNQPERKFKVGDVVNYIEGKSQNIWQGVTITKDTGDSYYATCPDAGDGAFREVWLELATTPAKFKVGDRVVAVQGTCLLNVGQQYEILRYEAEGRPVVAVYGEVRRFEMSYDDDWFAPTPPIGSQVTITATGRLSAINENGHYQVTFPGLPSGQNSFALPAAHMAAAN